MNTTSEYGCENCHDQGCILCEDPVQVAADYDFNALYDAVREMFLGEGDGFADDGDEEDPTSPFRSFCGTEVRPYGGTGRTSYGVMSCERYEDEIPF